MSKTTKTKFRPDRLLKLAEHLERGKLGHKVFDFSVWNSGERDRKGCGTAGCAVGECPIVFPRRWRFENYTPQLIDRRRHAFTTPITDASLDFGISAEEARAIFVSGRQFVPDAKLRPLQWDATRKQVAANIRRFVKWKLKQESP